MLRADATVSVDCGATLFERDATPPLTAMHHLIGAFPEADLEAHISLYAAAVRDVRAMLTTTEPYVRPARCREAHPFMQRDFHEIRRDKFAPGVVLSKHHFMHEACARAPPLAEADLRASAALDGDLTLAMDFIATRGPTITRAREERLAALHSVAAQSSCGSSSTCTNARLQRRSQCASTSPGRRASSMRCNGPTFCCLYATCAGSMSFLTYLTLACSGRTSSLQNCLSKTLTLEALRGLGEPTSMVIPRFASNDGRWRSSVEIAASVWG